MKITDYKNRIVKFFTSKSIKGSKIHNNYLVELVENLEYVKSKNKTISFLITEIKERGFIIKVGGLFGFVSFQHMPWQYDNMKYWEAISSEIINKKFFCKIHLLKKDPIKVLIDAKVHKFQKLEFSKKMEVEGIVLNNVKYGLFIEIGHYFNWKYGSCVGLLHKKNVSDFNLWKDKRIGEKINVVFHGFREDNKIILGDNTTIKEWLTGELDKYVGTTQDIIVKIDKQGNRLFLLEEKFPVQLPVTKTFYSKKNKTKIKSLLALVRNNEVLTCKIVHINYKKHKIIAKWLVNVETSLPKQNQNLINRINKKKSKDVYNLLVGNEIEVKVFKKDPNLGIYENKYFILNNIETKLTIKSYSYELSERDRGIIETNFKNGEIIKCIVSKIGKEIEVEYYIDRIKR